MHGQGAGAVTVGEPWDLGAPGGSVSVNGADRDLVAGTAISSAFRAFAIDLPVALGTSRTTTAGWT